MSLENIKSEFPLLESDPGLVYLDNAATTQKPRRVIDALTGFYGKSNANIHRGGYPLAESADRIYDGARKIVAEFVGAEPEQIIFTKNATEGANLLAFGIGEAMVRPGDNLIVTELEHHANYLPWQEMAKRRGAELRIWPLDIKTKELQTGWLEMNLDTRTKVVAVTMMSNVLGNGPDLTSIVSTAHQQGALVVADAAQWVAHKQVNFRGTGVDAAFFTGHKIYGPMGTGIVYISAELAEKIPPMLTGGGMIMDLPDKWFESPTKFEAGTPDVAGIAGLVEAIGFLRKIGWEKLAEHERSLAADMWDMLIAKPRVRLLLPDKKDLGSILAFEVEGIHPHDLASVLAEDKICVRAGHHCAKPLLYRLGVKAVTRISLGVYNRAGDVEAVETSLEKAFKLFS